MRTVAIFVFACLLTQAQAQRNLEVGVSSGVTHFYGDLGNLDTPVQWNSARPGLQITFRDFLNNPKRYVTRSLTTEMRLAWFRTGYDETAMIRGMSVKELRNYKRGLSFRNDLVGASAHIVLNAYRQPYQPLFQQRFFMYFHTGVGVYYGRPKADLFRGDIDLNNRYYPWADGTLRDVPRGTPEELSNVVQRDGNYETDLYSWRTESRGEGTDVNGGKEPSPVHVAIPLGAGVRYMITKQISLGIEYAYYLFTNDRVDDVSDRYTTWAEIESTYANSPTDQQLARYISDPSGGWGTDGEDTSIRTSPRGNPRLLDTMSYFSLEVSYKFKRRPSRRSFVSL
jgi:hypothetical protein